MIVQSDAVAQIKDAGCNRDLSFAPKLVATISEILRAQPCNFFYTHPQSANHASWRILSPSLDSNQI